MAGSKRALDNESGESAFKKMKTYSSLGHTERLNILKNILNREIDTEINLRVQDLETIQDRVYLVQQNLLHISQAVVPEYYHCETQKGVFQSPPHPAVKDTFCGKRPAMKAKTVEIVKDCQAASKETFENNLEQHELLPLTNGNLSTSETVGGKEIVTGPNSGHPGCNGKDIIQLGAARGNERKERYRVAICNVSKRIVNLLEYPKNAPTHKWTVYVKSKEGDFDIAKLLSRVVFFLDCNYKPNDVVNIEYPPFQLTRRGCTEFPLRVQMHFRNQLDQPLSIVHNVKLNRNQNGLEVFGGETIADVWAHPLESSNLNSIAGVPNKLTFATFPSSTKCSPLRTFSEMELSKDILSEIFGESEDVPESKKDHTTVGTKECAQEIVRQPDKFTIQQADELILGPPHKPISDHSHTTLECKALTTVDAVTTNNLNSSSEVCSNLIVTIPNQHENCPSDVTNALAYINSSNKIKMSTNIENNTQNYCSNAEVKSAPKSEYLPEYKTEFKEHNKKNFLENILPCGYEFFPVDNFDNNYDNEIVIHSEDVPFADIEYTKGDDKQANGNSNEEVVIQEVLPGNEIVIENCNSTNEDINENCNSAPECTKPELSKDLLKLNIPTTINKNHVFETKEFSFTQMQSILNNNLSTKFKNRCSSPSSLNPLKTLTPVVKTKCFKTSSGVVIADSAQRSTNMSHSNLLPVQASFPICHNESNKKIKNPETNEVNCEMPKAIKIVPLEKKKQSLFIVDSSTKTNSIQPFEKISKQLQYTVDPIKLSKLTKKNGLHTDHETVGNHLVKTKIQSSSKCVVSPQQISLLNKNVPKLASNKTVLNLQTFKKSFTTNNTILTGSKQPIVLTKNTGEQQTVIVQRKILPGVSLLKKNDMKSTRSNVLPVVKKPNVRPHTSGSEILQHCPSGKVEHAVSWLVKRCPLIDVRAQRDPIFKCTHPYCAPDKATYLSWHAAKQHAAEWMRAKKISKLLPKLCPNLQPWSTLQILDWARLMAYTPASKFCDPKAVKNVVDVKFEYTPPPNLPNLVPKEISTITNESEEIDIMSICSQQNSKGTNGKDPNPSKPLNLNLEDTFLDIGSFISGSCKFYSKNFSTEEICEGVLYPAALRIMISAFHSISEDLIRRSYAASMIRHCNLMPEVITQCDVHHAILSRQEFDLFTNEGLGCLENDNS